MIPYLCRAALTPAPPPVRGSGRTNHQPFNRIPYEPSNDPLRYSRLFAGAGLPKQRFHLLRHCAAALFLAQGVPRDVVMDILGHSQLATTMDLYSHVMPAAHREAADLMDRILAAQG